MSETHIVLTTEDHPEDTWQLSLSRSRSPLSTAQVEVLSAALRASSLDAREEASGVEHRTELQDDLGVSELPDCSLDQDARGPLVSAIEEVTSSVVFTK